MAARGILTGSEGSSLKRKISRVGSDLYDDDSERPSKRFQVKDKQFNHQFAAIYYERLCSLRPLALQAAQTALKNKGIELPVAEKVLDLDDKKKCLIVGTLYKEQKLKPSILDEYKVKHKAPGKRDKLTSSDDVIILEDEYGRIQLKFAEGTASGFSAGQLVTGNVAAIAGHQMDGQFQVDNLFFPGCPPQKQLPSPSADQARYVCFVSGLNLGDGHDPLPLQLLVDYLTGIVGGENDNTLASKVSRVILTGELLHRPDVTKKHTSKKKKKAEAPPLLDALKELDMLVTQLCSSVRVSVMPGPSDPSNFTLPQQPLHPCLFPTGRTFNTFESCTNPLNITTGGVDILGTAGQNINDMARYAEYESRIELLERLLSWRNLAPTAPDTLACYPFQENDPFILDAAPHIFFAGNQPEFSTKLYTGPDGQKVRLLLLPSFSTTGIVTLVDLQSLEVHPISFRTPSMDGTVEEEEEEGDDIELAVDDQDEFEMNEEEMMDEEF